MAGSPGQTRRHVLACGATAGVLACLPAFASADLPAEVAGILIPRSPLAIKVAAYARTSCPDFLFNHCMRTFLFGAVSMRKLGLAYDEDEAFAAAALHDLGLLTSFESPRGSFEIDGADAAEKYVTSQGMAGAKADRVWHAVVFHDGRWPITKRQGPEAMLVAAGAGADVDGPGTDIEPAELAEIVAAFPRLQFKQRFTRLAVDHCRRKPLSQQGTWLEGLCREQAPDSFKDSVEQEIARAPFAE